MSALPAGRTARRIALINPNTSMATTNRMVEIAQTAAGPDIDVLGLTAPFGASLITSPEALTTASHAVLSIPDTDFEGVSGIIVAAFGDPGADALGRRLRIPVVGIAEASMRAAAEVGRFSVVTTTPLMAESIRARAVQLGLGDHLASVRTTEGDAARLMSDEIALREALAVLVDAAVNHDGAETVIIGGGPLASVARELAAHAPVPLMEPVPIATRAIIARLSPARHA